MSVRRIALAAAMVAIASVAARVDSAAACSCALQDPRTALARADGAFVGTLVERRDTRSGPVRSSADPVTLVFRVERAVKGRLGRTVDVVTAAEGESCGVEASVGDRIGLFLHRDGKVWRSTLCSQVEPRKLLDAARPLPRPAGQGPVTLLVGGRFGPARMLTLDRRGRTLGYGKGPGETFVLALCPGSRRVAEVVADGADVLLAVRDLRSLGIVFERRLPFAWGGRAPSAVACVDAAGTQALVFATNPRRPSQATIVRVTAQRTATVWSGRAVAAWLGRRGGYLTGGERGDRLLAFSLTRRRATLIARLPTLTGALAPSPDGNALAGISTGPLTVAPSRLVLVDRGRVSSVRIGGSGAYVHWLDGKRVAVFRYGGPDQVRVYDRSLRLLARFGGWHAQQSAIAAGRAYGLGWNGTLQWARLPNGPARALRELPSPVAHTLLAVRG